MGKDEKPSNPIHPMKSRNRVLPAPHAPFPEGLSRVRFRGLAGSAADAWSECSTKQCMIVASQSHV